MHRTIDYNMFHDGDAARRQAINDLIDYIGKKRTRVLIRYIRNTPDVNFDAYAFWASLAGVTGFPVRALWAHVLGRDKELALLERER